MLKILRRNTNAQAQSRDSEQFTLFGVRSACTHMYTYHICVRMEYMYVHGRMFVSSQSPLFRTDIALPDIRTLLVLSTLPRETLKGKGSTKALPFSKERREAKLACSLRERCSFRARDCCFRLDGMTDGPAKREVFCCCLPHGPLTSLTLLALCVCVTFRCVLAIALGVLPEGKGTAGRGCGSDVCQMLQRVLRRVTCQREASCVCVCVRARTCFVIALTRVFAARHRFFRASSV